jgi:ABC-2 type transport system permease protein
MRVYLALVRRELGGYFASFTGYVIIAAVLLLLGLGFVDMLSKLNTEATHAPVTEMFFVTFYFWIILLLTAPVMTMRTFALERFSGTYETLMTTPVSDAAVVLAKFSGALLFYLLTWLPFLGYLVLVHRYAAGSFQISPQVLGGTYLGLLLVGSLYMAIGCFASSLTSNQIVAAILGYAMGLALFLLSLHSLAAPPGLKWTEKAYDYIAMSEHMENFARGVIDTRPIVFYGSFTLFFLYLTLKVVESRRWK